MMTNAKELPRELRRDVILYELNEVPWRVVDYYIERRPDSHLAALVRGGESLTTRHDDSLHLSPWRTWPSLHTSTYDHNSFDLGQDPATFRGDPIWDVADRAGLSVGIFGPMQSWPARQFRSGGFYIPDTFSQDSKTYPAALERFQRFNLAMTFEQGFSSNTPLKPTALLAEGFDLVRRGLTLRSACTLVAHLVSEKRDSRYKARRSALQALPAFDLYWRLHQTYRPRLSIFFTNHVAGMMHRYWGDAMPDYAYEYETDEVYGNFIMTAMDYTDRQLGRIRKHLAANPASMLVIAASMGQGPIPTGFTDRDLFVLEDPAQLLSRLGLKPAEVRLAMYPGISLVFADDVAAREAIIPLESVRTNNGRQLFSSAELPCRQEGRSVTFMINLDAESRQRTRLRYLPIGADAEAIGTPADLGLAVRQRLGGGNTAYHIPHGMLLAYGAGIAPDSSRKEVDVLDVAPSLLANLLNVPPARTMRGSPSLFAQGRLHSASDTSDSRTPA
ncbi:hypothetical protein [Mycolicibacter sinensis]|uniref:hypothetical protein n=1 Tax=Mycolicibacter sinensis (strain JDM601) TaxID=875328 RepID=UPI00104269E4|nr:hypothetical protein [Mycolicibacter sinensis]